MSARIVKQTVEVVVSVEFHGNRPLDERRLEWISRTLKAYADGELASRLASLRFDTETVEKS